MQVCLLNIRARRSRESIFLSFLHPTVRGSNRLVTQYHVIDFVKSSKAIIKSMLHVLIVLIGSDDWIVKKLGLLLRTACRHNHQYS